MKVSDLPSRCFQGVLPSIITTCDAEGIPNVTYLSQVYYVDAGHVALSCQFFNKTKKNVLANPWACLQVLDPITLEAYRIELHYLRDEREGPLFESMSRDEWRVYHCVHCAHHLSFVIPTDQSNGAHA